MPSRTQLRLMRAGRIKGAATLLCPNGDRVSGTFVTPSWDGRIVCQFGDGSRFDGVWDYPWPHQKHNGAQRLQTTLAVVRVW